MFERTGRTFHPFNDTHTHTPTYAPTLVTGNSKEHSTGEPSFNMDINISYSLFLPIGPTASGLPAMNRHSSLPNLIHSLV